MSNLLNTIKENVSKVYEAGHKVGYEEGKQTEYDKFWETYQANGTRNSYRSGFADYWTDETYNPKYPIVCGNSNVYTAESLFAKASITDTKVPISVIGTRADSIFQDCTMLKRILSLTFENVVRFTNNCFRNCRELEELNLYGTVDIDGLDLQWSTKLNKASIESVINCLSTTTTGLTVTLSKTAVNNAFETSEGLADGSISSEWTTLETTKPNWTISLV